MKLIDEISYVEGVATSHDQVGTFKFCEPWEVLGFIKPGLTYPLVMLNPTTTTYGQQVITRSYTMSVMDMPSKKFDNVLQVQSDCEQILVDILNKIVYEDEEAVFTGEPSGSIFKENFGDWCAGVSVEITIETNNPGSCDMPFS